MMQLRQLDPEFARKRRGAWRQAASKAAWLLGVMWLVWLLDVLTSFNPRFLGIYPGSVTGLTGVFLAPLLHSGLAHLVANTLPVFLAIVALFGNYPKVARRVLFVSWVGTGLLVWLLARPAWHLGASGLLYALLGFLFASGFLRKDMQSVAISLLLVFLYGGFIFGVIPDKPEISWESHLLGLLIGVLLAWWYRHEDPPVFRQYELDDDEDEANDDEIESLLSQPATMSESGVSGSFQQRRSQITEQPHDCDRP